MLDRLLYFFLWKQWNVDETSKSTAFLISEVGKQITDANIQKHKILYEMCVGFGNLLIDASSIIQNSEYVFTDLEVRNEPYYIRQFFYFTATDEITIGDKYSSSSKFGPIAKWKQFYEKFIPIDEVDIKDRETLTQYIPNRYFCSDFFKCTENEEFLNLLSSVGIGNFKGGNFIWNVIYKRPLDSKSRYFKPTIEILEHSLQNDFRRNYSGKVVFEKLFQSFVMQNKFNLISNEQEIYFTGSPERLAEDLQTVQNLDSTLDDLGEQNCLDDQNNNEIATIGDMMSSIIPESEDGLVEQNSLDDFLTSVDSISNDCLTQTIFKFWSSNNSSQTNLNISNSEDDTLPENQILDVQNLKRKLQETCESLKNNKKSKSS